MENRFSYNYCIIGAVIGFFIFHPLIMLFSHFMATHNVAQATTGLEDITSVILKSFSTAMLPWSLSFTVFNGIIGCFYGKFKAEKIAREELIENLQKALADVKTLSGMMPICAWCKNIRNDEGYWQKIEAYLKSHSDLDFTHGICNDCVKKEFPGLSPELNEKMDDENPSSRSL